MGFITTLIGGVASGGWGAIIGTLGGGIKKWFEDRHELKMAELQMREHAADRQHDLALADKEIEKATKVAQMELEEKQFAADAEALTTGAKSQDNEITALRDVLGDSWQWAKSMAALAFTGVTVVQKLIRPVITLYLVILTTYLFSEVSKALGGIDNLPPSEMQIIYKHIISAVLGMTELAVSFWFMARPNRSNVQNDNR